MQINNEEQAAPLKVILPPPAIRLIIDKTAHTVSTKGGLALEDKIREREKTNPKFSFLIEGDPYHPYYQMKVSEFTQMTLLGQEIILDTGKREGDFGMEQQEAVKKRKVLTEPEKFEFLFQLPILSALDLDIIKLTALYAARNGKSFLSSLAQKESKNYQFDFIRPNHSLFPTFQQYIEIYKKILLPSPALKSKLQLKASQPFQLLDKCMERMEWEREMEQQRQKKEEEEEKDRFVFLSIDWHDFVVAQTIDFTPADVQMALPPPTSVESLQRLPLAQRQHQAPAQVQQSVAVEEEDMEME